MPNLISIGFEYQYNENGSWEDEDNVSKTLEFSKFDECIRKMKNGQEIVIPMKTIIVIVNYPFKYKPEYAFTIKADTGQGFSREGLARKIYNIYKRIYDQENTALQNWLPSPYGILTRYFKELVLAEVFQEKEEGKNIFRLKLNS